MIGYPLIAWAMASFVIVGASPTGLIGRLCVPGVRWMAPVSYSVYLIHKPIFKQVQAHLPIWFGSHPYLTFLVYSMAALIAGAVLHCAIERPFLRFRDRSRKQQTRFAESADDICESPITAES